MKKYEVDIDIVPQDEDEPVPSFEPDVTVWGPAVRGPGNTDGYPMEVIAATALRKSLKCRKGKFDFCSSEVRNIVREKHYKAEWVDDNDFPNCDYYLHGVLYYKNECFNCTVKITDLSGYIYI